MEAHRSMVTRYKQTRFYSNDTETSKDSCGRKGSLACCSLRRSDSRRNRRVISDDQSTSLVPCTKSPSARQCKNSKENLPGCKTPLPAGDRLTKKGDRNISLTIKNRMDGEDEFPPLGISSFTPESGKDWGSIVDEHETSGKQQKSRYKRKLLLSESTEDGSRETKRKALLTDPHKLQQRQKQIDIGKNTLAYGRYLTSVPRELRTSEDPQTPNKFKACSTRSWVGQIKIWRRKLHIWDPPCHGTEKLFSSSSQGESEMSALDLSCERPDDIASSSSQSSIQLSDETKMEVDNNEFTSISTLNSIDDIFKDFDLDACLVNDGLPL